MQTIVSRFASQDGKTHRQLRTTALTAVDSFVNVLILFGFAAVGTVPYEVALSILLITIAINTVFLGSIAFGVTQRFSESTSTGGQVLAVCGINLLGLLYAPQISYMFIVNLFAPLSYGNLYFNRRMFLYSSLLLSWGLGAVIMLGGVDAAIAYESDGERVLFWGVVAIALGRFLAVNSEIARIRDRLQSKNSKLTEETAELADLTSRDALTGLWNRREFMRLLQDESRRAVRNRLSFCVVVIDIDNFRQISEKFGQSMGDTVLQEFAQFLEDQRRATDAIARYDAEKFALILAGAKVSTAMVMLERMRHEVTQQDWESILPGLQLTITAGAAAWRPGETLTSVLDRAEAALDDAKSVGHNCVRVSTPLQPVTA